jgi:hypothetical protein
MKVFLAALLLLAIGVVGMCFNILFRKNGQFPQTDVGSNENMKKLGIKCMKEEEDEIWGDKAAGAASKKKATCSGVYSSSCIGCGLYPYSSKDKKE